MYEPDEKKNHAHFNFNNYYRSIFYTLKITTITLYFFVAPSSTSIISIDD